MLDRLWTYHNKNIMTLLKVMSCNKQKWIRTMGNRVTIKDVAREANVSIKTVSNVLNDTGSMRPDTRRRVER